MDQRFSGCQFLFIVGFVADILYDPEVDLCRMEAWGRFHCIVMYTYPILHEGVATRLPKRKDDDQLIGDTLLGQLVDLFF